MEMRSNSTVRLKGIVCFNISVTTVEKSLQIRCKTIIKLYFKLYFNEDLLFFNKLNSKDAAYSLIEYKRNKKQPI